MARSAFRVEKGLEIMDENAVSGVTITQGSADPTADEAVGSIYMKTTGEFFQKTAAGAGAGNWKQIDVTNVETALGIADKATDMGTFTGTILTDNTTARALFQELEVDMDALQTLTGVAAEAVDLGTFTGSIIPDSSTIKAALQSLETYTEGIQIELTDDNVTIEESLDEVLVDNIAACEWYVYVRDNATPSQVEAFKVMAVHDGTPAADAVATDNTEYGKLKLNGGTDIATIIDLSGVGAAQVMRLRVSSTAGVDIRAIRRKIDF